VVKHALCGRVVKLGGHALCGRMVAAALFGKMVADSGCCTACVGAYLQLRFLKPTTGCGISATTHVGGTPCLDMAWSEGQACYLLLA
jgi:hypothetical protein